MSERYQISSYSKKKNNINNKWILNSREYSVLYEYKKNNKKNTYISLKLFFILINNNQNYNCITIYNQ